MFGYLSLDNICSLWLTVFLELPSRKSVRFSEQIMSADKYPSIFFRAKWRLLFMYLYKIILTNFFCCYVNPKRLSEYTLYYSKMLIEDLLQFQIHVLIIIMHIILSRMRSDTKVEYYYRKLPVFS